jgi:hypothetical protein
MRLVQILKVSLPILSFMLAMLAGPAAAQPRDTARSPASANIPSNDTMIPPGTILPVRLRTAISSQKCKSGQLIVGRTAQNVPLPNGSKIRAGTKIEGQIIGVTPGGPSSGPQLSIRFDKVYTQGKTISVKTSLRAIAGFMAVQEAGVPEESPGEGTPYDWLPTTQIGGDSVYGLWGPVMSAEDSSQVVGKSTYDGVLARPRAKQGSQCRGGAEGNDNPQAMWVFSTDACGVYGIEHLNITHAGRTMPVGTIVLVSEAPILKLRNGDGLLLRVNAVSHD